MNTSIRKFLAEEDGVTALEYGVLAAIVSLAIVAVFNSSFQPLLQHIFNKIKNAVG
jgi:pilus assembly protein Flp/PilA